MAFHGWGACCWLRFASSLTRFSLFVCGVLFVGFPVRLLFVVVLTQPRSMVGRVAFLSLTDGYGTCEDLCTSDATKHDINVCGCGTPDADTDGNGVVDCLEDADAPNTVSVDLHVSVQAASSSAAQVTKAVAFMARAVVADALAASSSAVPTYKAAPVFADANDAHAATGLVSYSHVVVVAAAGGVDTLRVMVHLAVHPPVTASRGAVAEALVNTAGVQAALGAAMRASSGVTITADSLSVAVAAAPGTAEAAIQAACSCAEAASHAEHMGCVSRVVADLQERGALSAARAQQAVRDAASSMCGSLAAVREVTAQMVGSCAMYDSADDRASAVRSAAHLMEAWGHVSGAQTQELYSAAADCTYAQAGAGAGTGVDGGVMGTMESLEGDDVDGLSLEVVIAMVGAGACVAIAAAIAVLVRRRSSRVHTLRTTPSASSVISVQPAPESPRSTGSVAFGEDAAAVTVVDALDVSVPSHGRPRVLQLPEV